MAEGGDSSAWRVGNWRANVAAALHTALRRRVASRREYANQWEKSEMSDTRSERSSLIAARSGVGLSDLTTVVAVGVVAATLAAVCHETLGHGLGCVVDGGRITLLTSI